MNPHAQQDTGPGPSSPGIAWLAASQTCAYRCFSQFHHFLPVREMGEDAGSSIGVKTSPFWGNTKQLSPPRRNEDMTQARASSRAPACPWARCFQQRLPLLSIPPAPPPQPSPPRARPPAGTGLSGWGTRASRSGAFPGVRAPADKT